MSHDDGKVTVASEGCGIRGGGGCWDGGVVTIGGEVCTRTSDTGDWDTGSAIASASAVVSWYSSSMLVLPSKVLYAKQKQIRNQTCERTVGTALLSGMGTGITTWAKTMRLRYPTSLIGKSPGPVQSFIHQILSQSSTFPLRRVND